MKFSGMKNKKNYIWFIVSIVVLIAVAFVPFYTPAYYISLVLSIFMYIIMTISWAVFAAPTNYVSLASAAFLGIGMYTTAILGELLPLPLVFLAGGLAASILAFLVGLISLRVKGVFFCIATLGLAELLRHFINWYEISIAGHVGRYVVLVDSKYLFYSMFITFLLTLATAWIIRRSRYGLALKSIGDAEEAADHIGVNVNAVKVITFTGSSFWIGVAGAIIVAQWTYVESEMAFSMIYSFMPTLMGPFGGMATIFGWVLGARIFSVIAEVLSIKFPSLYMLLFGLVIISIMIFFPDGLIGLAKKWRKKAQ